MKKKELDEIFGNMPGAKKVADGYLLDDENVRIAVLDVHAAEELKGLDQYETSTCRYV